MTLDEFNCISRLNQFAVVKEYGEFLAVRLSSRYSVYLFYLGDFYAEVCHRHSENEINSIRGFKNIAYLDPYLQMVDVSEVMG
ncbi:MAG: hypothetical protein M3Q05_06215 [Bacteroidota bacterium]|nr:hypothetical protein [Bacteroidota bacterium]